jgi:hypothetical protein
VINLLTEHVLSLAEACRVVPPARGGKSCHISTLLRWITHGVSAPSGERVRLRASRLGSRWLTSREAIAEFMEALTPCQETPALAQTPRTPGKRRRDAEQSGRKLESLGI